MPNSKDRPFFSRLSIFATYIYVFFAEHGMADLDGTYNYKPIPLDACDIVPLVHRATTHEAKRLLMIKVICCFLLVLIFAVHAIIWGGEAAFVQAPLLGFVTLTLCFAFYAIYHGNLRRYVVSPQQWWVLAGVCVLFMLEVMLQCDAIHVLNLCFLALEFAGTIVFVLFLFLNLYFAISRN